jgi:VWFA-related protein
VEIRELFYPPLDQSLIVQITTIETSPCPAIRSTVLVTDVNGVPVEGLGASNFSVYEDDQRQTPITVEPGASDVAVTLALDYSGSMSHDAIADMEAAAILFVDLLSSQDTGEILKFASGIEVVQEYTSDKAALIEAIARPTGLDRDATQLYDTIYQGISDIAEQSGNKAVVVMSDGRNTYSQKGASQAIAHAESTGVSIFTIGLGTSVDEDVLRAMAVKTGGVYYFAPQSQDLMAIYAAIAGTLKNQYVVTYETASCEPDNPDGSEHDLEITVSVGTAYGQGAKRFTCPTSCGPGENARADD